MMSEQGYSQPVPFALLTGSMSRLNQFRFDPPVKVSMIAWATDGKSILAYGPEDEDGRRIISLYDLDGDRFAFGDSAVYRKTADGSWHKETG